MDPPKQWNAILSLLSLLPHLLSFKVLLMLGFHMFLWLFSTEGFAGSISRIPWQTQNPELKQSTSTLSPLIPPSLKGALPFSASACRTSKTISNLSWFSALLSCFTSCSATFVLLRASLAVSVYMIKSGF